MAEIKVSHRSRLEACLSNEVADQIPVALWRHFPVDDQSPDQLAAATINFQRTFDFDLIKVTPSSSFCIRDWGVRDEWRGNPEGTRDYTVRAIRGPDDWERLPLLDPLNGSLGAQITCLRTLVKELGPATPIIQSIFSPMSQAKNLAGPENLAVYLNRFPDALEMGLQKITETTIRFIEEIKKTGISGIFYAVQHGQYGLLSIDEFKRFAMKFDLQILEATKDLWLNMLHMHGTELMLDQVVDYPVQIINWHDRQTPPSLAEAQKMFKGVVCGGLRQWDTMVLGTPERIRQEAEDAIAQCRGRRFILGTGCVLPITAPYGNILAARQSTANPFYL